MLQLSKEEGDEPQVLDCSCDGSLRISVSRCLRRPCLLLRPVYSLVSRLLQYCYPRGFEDLVGHLVLEFLIVCLKTCRILSIKRVCSGSEVSAEPARTHEDVREALISYVPFAYKLDFEDSD